MRSLLSIVIFMCLAFAITACGNSLMSSTTRTVPSSTVMPAVSILSPKPSISPTKVVQATRIIALPASITRTPIPPYYIPPEVLEIQPINPIEFADGPIGLRYATSMWHIGAVIGSDEYEVCSIFLFARRPWQAGTPTPWATVPDHTIPAKLAMAPFCNELPHDWRRYQHVWALPEDLGTVTITKISDLQLYTDTFAGLVHVTTSDGHNGTFDLATEHWNLAAR